MSPLEISLNKKKPLNQKGNQKIKCLNLISVILLLVLVFSYALSANQSTGKNLTIQRLEKNKEELSEKIREQNTGINAFRTPSYIHAKMKDYMIKTEKFSYLGGEESGGNDIAVNKR